MNKKQSIIVYAAVAIIVAMILIPPYAMPGLGSPIGYDFIWNNTLKMGSIKVAQIPIAYERLALQVAVAVIIAIIGFVAFRGGKKR